MKKVNRIRIFFILTVLLIVSLYRFMITTPKHAPEETATEQIAAETQAAGSETEKSIFTSSTVIDYQYLIVEENDYLTVYSADDTTVYEYTDIRYSDLDDHLRHKIRNGYYIKDDAELFGFLENYSS